MSRGHRTFEPSAAHAEQASRRANRAYTISQICERLSIARRTFFTLRSKGQLPFLEEVQPRLGKRPRYRADLVDQYAANEFNRVSA